MGDFPVGRAWSGEDHSGAIRSAHVHQKNGHNFGLTLTRRFLDFNPEFRPFLEPTKGNDMAQNVGFTGQPTVIFAGVNSGAKLTGTTTGTTSDHLIDSSETFTSGTIIVPGMIVKNTTSGNEYATITAVASNDLTIDSDIFLISENYEINPIWVGTAIQGTWNFADGGEVSVTTANNSDAANFSNDAGEVWDVDDNGFLTLTGAVDLDIYSELTNEITLQFDLNGTVVGDAIGLNTFINTADFTKQSFAIPVADFNFGGTSEINGLTITITRNGGQRPTIKFDDFQWEEIGEILEYKVAPRLGELFHVTEIRIAMADDEAGTLTDATMPRLSFNQLLSVTVLSQGIVFKRVKAGETLFSVTIKQLGDFLATGSNLINVISDGTNTFLTLLVTFPEAIILDGDTGDFLSFTISDNLSSLLQFTAAARGAIEI